MTDKLSKKGSENKNCFQEIKEKAKMMGLIIGQKQNPLLHEGRI